MDHTMAGGLIARGRRGALRWQPWLLLAVCGGFCPVGLFGCSSDAPQAIAVAVAPAAVTLAPGGTQQFVAAVTGTQRTTVTWSVEPGACGSITSAGAYTAPAAEGSCAVRATTQVDPSKSAAAAVAVVKSGPGLPVIASFTASPAAIAAGATSTLVWSVTGADSLLLDQGVGAVSVTATSTSVQPAATTTYTLTATSAAGAATKAVNVTVTAAGAPVISAFTATPASINAGETSTLAWSVTGATSLSIDKGVGVVTGTSKTVQPTASTTYTLTATNAAGPVTMQATVSVGTGTPPAITTFTATPAQITAGQSTTLAWTLSGGPATLSIDQGVGTVTGASKSVSPTASTTYLLSATDAGVTVTMPVTVTVSPATPAAVIHEFAVDSAGIDASNGSAVARVSAVTIKGGGSATLRWSVANSNSGQISIDQGIGTQPASSSKVVSPAATTTYTLTASGGGKSVTAQVTVGVNPVPFLGLGTVTGSADVTVTVDSGAAVRPISPYVYGYNAGKVADAPSGATWLRQGGNRWTAWNWENNYSNAGIDYGPYHNDDFLSSSTTPGAAIKPTLDETQSASGPGYATLVTLPLQGWVSSLFFGNVSATAPQRDHFFPSSPRKGSAPLTSPSTTDGVVYQDELVHWIDVNYPLARTDPKRPIHFSLDNEPDLWSSTHAELQRGAVTYAGLISKSIDLAAAVKDQLPGALVYGPASYGWAGYLNLQSAPDAANRDFLDTDLAAMKTASEAQGRRLLDVLDLHFYSEVYAGNTRINQADNSAPVAAARVQAPRSLWEGSYVENSWINGCCVNVTAGDGQPGVAPVGVDLVPRMLGKIAARFPGTRLAITEYDHGGADHISGAVAQADTLGIFGRSGVYAASHWPEGTVNNNQHYVFGAYRLYRNYDGAGGVFGDTSISAVSSDWSKVSAHASFHAGHPEKVFVVVLNRDTVPRTVALKLNHTQTLSTYTAYQIAEPVQVTGNSVIPKALGSQSLSATNAATLNLCSSGVTGCVTTTSVPPMSATLLVLQ